MNTQETECCAVDILYGVHNHNTVEQIRVFVKKCLDFEPSFEGDDIDGPTALICFTSPEEEVLARTLKEVGFRKLTTVQRRKEVANQAGTGRKPLTMWIIHRRDVKGWS